MHRAPDIEKVHLEFLKSVLGVRRNTNTTMIYFETGRLPLYHVRILRMFKFWFKLLYYNLKIVYLGLHMNIYTTFVKIQSEIVIIGLPSLRNNLIV